MKMLYFLGIFINFNKIKYYAKINKVWSFLVWTLPFFSAYS
nr:MAG TPA: hypothetical protein [Caudoviricetes sp.]